MAVSIPHVLLASDDSNTSPVARMNDLHLINQISEYLVDGEYLTWLTWCSMSPSTMLSGVLCNKDNKPNTKRMPEVCEKESSDDGTSRLSFNVRSERDGIMLNRSHKPESCATVTTNMHLLSTIWPGEVTIRLVSLNTTLSDQLLRCWQPYPRFKVNSIVTKDLTSLVGPFQREEGDVFSSLKTVEAVELLTSATPDFFLKGIDSLRQVRAVNLGHQRIRTLIALKLNPIISYVDVCDSEIGDLDIKILSELPSLSYLNVSECHKITNLNPLSASPALHTLNASNCSNLLLFSALGSIDTLRDIDLSHNHLREEELITLLSSITTFISKAAFAGVRFPSRAPRCKFVLPQLTSLSLVGADVPCIEWLARMPQLMDLALDRSTITNSQLADLASRPAVLVEKLSINGCDSLLTSLDFVEGMKWLSVMHISGKSIAESNMLASLEKRGKSIYVN